MNLTSGEITIRRAAAGFQSELNLGSPPHVTGHVVVGVFHTHPNPSAEGWEPGPSEADRPPRRTRKCARNPSSIPRNRILASVAR